MDDRIAVDKKNVARLMDEAESGFWPEWMTAKDLTETFKVSRTQLYEWAKAGHVEERGTGRMFGSKEQKEYRLLDFLRERVARRCQKHRMVEERDGVLHVQCVDCPEGDNMHPKSAFYANDGSALGVGVRCKPCHNKRGAEWERNNKKAGAAKRKRAARKSAARARAAFRWEPPKFVASSDVLEMLERRWPKPPHTTQPTHDKNLCEQAGVTEDFIRSVRRASKSKVELVDALFTGLEMTDELSVMHAELEKDRPAWHPKHPYCVRCYRVGVPHHAKGLCRTCHRNRNVPGWQPPLAKLGHEAWSMYHPCCVECSRTDSHHHARGWCDRCYQRDKARRIRAAERAAQVGSGHGNDGSVQSQAEAPDDRLGGRGHSGRLAS